MAVGGSIIGALRVILGADTAQFETGLKKGSRGLDQFAKDAKLAAAAVATAMAAAATALGVAIQGKLNDFDRLAKSADKVGLPVDELIRLRHAAQLAGVETKTLDMAMQRFSRRVGEAAQGGGELKGILDQYNIAVTDSSGKMRPLTDIMGDLADRMKAAGSSQEQLRMAFKAFDSEGAALVNMMRNGSGAMREMMAEADALGIVIDTKTAKAAEEFNNNLVRLRRVFDGLITQVTAQLAPALAMFSGALVTLANNSENTKRAASGIVTVIKTVVEVAYTAAVIFRRLGAELSAFWEVLKSDNLANTRKVWAEFQAEGEKTAAQLKAIPETLAKFWSDAEAHAEKFTSSEPARTAVVVQSAEAIKQKLKEQKEAAREATRAWEQMWAEGNRIYEQTRTPLEQFQAGMERLNDLMREGVITTDTYKRAVFQLQDQFTGASQYANQFLGSLESGFVNVVTKAKSVSDAAKQLLQDFARLAAQWAFRSLMGGFGGGGILGGVGKLFGFAQGGSFQVGGSGGIDSQLVAFKASPNERVTVTKPGQEMGGGGVVYQTTNHFHGPITPDMKSYINRQIAMSEARSAARTPGIVAGHRSNNPGFLRR